VYNRIAKNLNDHTYSENSSHDKISWAFTYDRTRFINTKTFVVLLTEMTLAFLAESSQGDQMSWWMHGRRRKRTLTADYV